MPVSEACAHDSGSDGGEAPCAGYPKFATLYVSSRGFACRRQSHMRDFEGVDDDAVSGVLLNMPCINLSTITSTPYLTGVLLDLLCINLSTCI